MKGVWPHRRIGDLCHIATGGTPSRTEKKYFGGDIKWLVSGDIHRREIFDCEGRITEAGMTNSNAKLLPVNSVLIALNGQGKTRGTVALLRTSATCNQSLVCMSPKNPNTLLPEFLFANLDGRYEEIRRMTGDSGDDRRGLNMGIISRIEVPLPPATEQQRIVGILDNAFAAIATAKANTEKNLQNARAAFQSYRNLAFSTKDHWQNATLDQISKNVDSQRIPVTKSKRKAGPYPYYGASGIVDHVAEYIFEGDALLVSEDGANLLARSTPIAFSVSGRYWVNNHAHILKFESLATQKFVEHFLESIPLDQYVRGAAQPKLTQAALNSIPIRIPRSTAVQAEVVNRLEMFLNNTELARSAYRTKLSELDQLKESLLNAAFSGAL